MLCVYDKYTPQNGFNNNGVAILRPSLMKTYEELNGDYSVEIQYPITPDDMAWTYLTPFAIVRNSEGQLFVIHTCGTEMTSSGNKVWAAQARHISYYLADKLVRNCQYTNYDCYYALCAIKDHTEISWGSSPSGNYVEYDFTYSSDITDKHFNINYNNINPIAVLLGASDSIVNLYGGEIHRDNFSISVNKRKQGSRDNSFSIIHGINMQSVRENITVNDMLTTVHTEDNLGAGKSLAYTSARYSPHQIIKYVKFSYDDETSYCDRDTDAYFEDHKAPTMGYELRFKDLKNQSQYSDWAKLQRYNVGDSGTIYSEMLKINTTQKIISRTLNDITEEVEEIALGNFMPNLFANNKYNSMVAKRDSSGKRLDVLESRKNDWFEIVEDV